MATVPRNPFGNRKVKLDSRHVPLEFKAWAVDRINSGALTAIQIAKKYDLTRVLVSHWVWKIKNGFTLCDGPGAPPLLPQEALEKVVEAMTDAPYDIRRKDFCLLLNKTASEAAESRGRSGAVVSVSNATLLRAANKIGVKSAKAEATTTARALACSEIRNQVSLAAMMESFPEIHPKLVMNFDSSGFTVGGNGADAVDVKYVPTSKAKKTKTEQRSAPSRGLQVRPDSEASNFVHYTIKYMLLMCAGGDQCDPIYCVADPNMTEDEFRVYPVPGLGVGTNFDNQGFVCMTKDRHGNAPFHKWLVTDRVVAFANRLRKFYKIGEEQIALLNIDGESAQVDAMFTKEVREALADHRIIVGKFPAATTGINQPCDARNCFKGPKTQNKKIGDKDVKGNVFMLSTLSDMFATHNEWLNSDERGDNRAKGKKKKYIGKKDKPNAIAFDAAHMRMCKFGLLRVQLALQMCMRPHMIRESFQCTGLYPRSTTQILSNCRSKLTTATMTTITGAMPELVNLFKLQGEIFEADFDRLGISCSHEREGKPLDELIIIRRRAVILTHPEVITRQAKYETIAERMVKKRKAALKTEVVVGNKRIKFSFAL